MISTQVKQKLDGLTATLKTSTGLEAAGTVSPRQLSRQLRRGKDPLLEKRRGILSLSLVAAASMGMISLYQMGIIRRLPEPPLPYLDAEKVDASDQAYEWFSTPDGVLGLVNYSVTALLAAIGAKDRARRNPWIPLLLTGKAIADAGQAARLTKDQWTKHRAFCSYCLVAAAATFAIVPLTFPEAKVAAKRLFRV